MILTRLRLVLALLGLLGAGVWLWTVHDRLADARVSRALERAAQDHRAETEREAKAETHEHDIQKHDAAVVGRAPATLDGLDYSACPPVPADFLRLLNAIGTAGPAAGAPAGEMLTPAETSRD